MDDSQNGCPTQQSSPTSVPAGANIAEDEIDLFEYFSVVWKRKNLILLGSILPALLVGLILFFSPRDYKVTYTYDGLHLNSKEDIVLLESFYSSYNINMLVSKLQENSLSDYAARIKQASESRPDAIEELLAFEAWPSYVELSNVKVTDPNIVEQLRQLTAQFLRVSIVGRPKSDIPKIALVIRDNVESVMSISSIERELISSIRKHRAQMADIEEGRFGLELDLEGSKLVLGKLKDTEIGSLDGGKGNIGLQFDISGKTEYLPVGYQIQATESKNASLEGSIANNEKKYSHYEGLLRLNERLFAELERHVSSYYTIQQFRSFAASVVKDYKDKQLTDYLNSYLKKIDNRISASAPVTEHPGVYAVSKGTVKKSAIVFAACLMISILVAFLLEGLQRRRAEAALKSYQ